MNEDQKFYARNIETNHILSGLDRNAKIGRHANRFSRIIPRAAVKLNPEKKVVIGGDTDDPEQDTPPAIILEKEHELITRIFVKCPCGRHAELICDYDEE